jgi:hypothetical protein
MASGLEDEETPEFDIRDTIRLQSRRWVHGISTCVGHTSSNPTAESKLVMCTGLVEGQIWTGAPTVGRVSDLGPTHNPSSCLHTFGGLANNSSMRHAASIHIARLRTCPVGLLFEFPRTG